MLIPETVTPVHRQSGGGDYDRARAERKAQRRGDIRRVAQQLFADRGFDAVTIADIASAASVSVQTVFNHFAAKEELFFDGRSGWIDGPAAAVRSRAPDVSPLMALRDHLVETVWDTVHLEATPERRSYLEAIDASPALRVYEMGLFHDAECRLTEALAAAWATDPSPGYTPLTGGIDIRAALTSATWLAAARVVATSHRLAGGDDATRASEAADQANRTLLRLEASFLEPQSSQPI